MSRWDRWIAPILGVPIGLALFYFYQLWMVPIPIELYEREAHPIDVTAGTIVTVTWREKRTDHCFSVIQRQIIGPDNSVVQFEPIQNDVRPLGENSHSFVFTVPRFEEPGLLVYRVKSEFFCNKVQEYFGGPILPLPDIKLRYTMTKRDLCKDCP